MEKSILRFPVLPPSKSQQIFCALTVWAAAALPEARSHYDLGAESWGNFNSAVSGRAAGRHVPAWVSVGLCTPPASPVGAPVCAAAAGARRSAPLGDAGGKSVVPPLSVIFFFHFFCPETTGFWLADLSQSALAKGSRKACRTAICTSFVQNPSYHFNYSKL